MVSDPNELDINYKTKNFTKNIGIINNNFKQK